MAMNRAFDHDLASAKPFIVSLEGLSAFLDKRPHGIGQREVI